MEHYELIFRDTLPQFWRLIHAEWQRQTRSLGNPLFQLTANNLNVPPYAGYIPPENDRIQLSFGTRTIWPAESDIVSVETYPIPGKPRLKLRVYISTMTYEKNRLEALASWHTTRQVMERKDLLGPSAGGIIEYLSEPQQTLASQPGRKAPLFDWFKWRDKMDIFDLKIGLAYIARETKHDKNYVRQRHSRYKKEHG